MTLELTPAGKAHKADPPRRSSRRGWWAAGIGVAVLLLGAVWFGVGRQAAPEYGIPIDATTPAGDFTLDSTRGSPLSLSDLRGKFVLLYFGYTYCPDICPTTLADLRVMLTELGDEAQDVQVLFVSVDPQRDTVERMAAYLDHFDPAMIGLTGSLPAVEDIASRFGVFFEQHRTAGATDYLVDHTSAVLVIDPDGHLRLMFPYGVRGEQMASDLRRLKR